MWHAIATQVGQANVTSSFRRFGTDKFILEYNLRRSDGDTSAVIHKFYEEFSESDKTLGLDWKNPKHTDVFVFIATYSKLDIIITQPSSNGKGYIISHAFIAKTNEKLENRNYLIFVSVYQTKYDTLSVRCYPEDDTKEIPHKEAIDKIIHTYMINMKTTLSQVILTYYIA